MLWNLYQPGLWFWSDVFYVASLLVLLYGFWLASKRHPNSSVCFVIGFIMVLTAFMTRFTSALFLLMPSGREEFKIIALARSFLHTLVLPSLMTVLWIIGFLIYEQIARRRKWWQTALCLMIIVVCAAWWVISLYPLCRDRRICPGEPEYRAVCP